MLIGAHVPDADPLGEARALGAEAIQMFLGNPQSFEKPPPRADIEALRKGGIPIYVHAPYRLNVVHPSPRVRVPSRKTLSQTVDAAAAIGAAGVMDADGILSMVRAAAAPVVILETPWAGIAEDMAWLRRSL